MRSDSLLVYLDFNVMVFLFDGRLPELSSLLNDLLRVGAIQVPFSREHVVEAMRGVDESTDVVRERARMLLDWISGLTGDLYMLTEPKTGHLQLIRWSPHEVYDQTVAIRPDAEEHGDPLLDAVAALARVQMRLGIRMWGTLLDQIAASGVDVSDLRKRLNALEAEGGDVRRAADELMQIIFTATSRSTHHLDAQGFTPSKLNNESSETASEKINEKLVASGAPLDLQGISAWIAQNAPKLGHHPIAGHVGMLGMMGYNRGKASVGAPSRMSDLGHVELGLRADVFVTDDRRLRNRARATAHELGLPVVVADVQEAPVVLRRLVPGV